MADEEAGWVDDADVEAHKKRFHAAEDAEAPEDAGEIRADDDDYDENDVEGVRKRFH